MELTTNANLVTRVYTSVSYNDIFPDFDAESDNELPENFDNRVADALNALARNVKNDFPNVIDIWIESTGWDGDYAQFTPRADNPELDLDYEYFFDWLSSIQQCIAYDALNPVN